MPKAPPTQSGVIPSLPAEFRKISRLHTRIWPGILGCTLLSGVCGLIILWRVERASFLGEPTGLTWRVGLLLALCWGIPLISLLALWSMSVRQHRRHIVGITALTTAVHRSQPDLYGESDFQTMPEEFRVLVNAINGLETRYRHSVQTLHRDLRDARANYESLHHLFSSANVMLFGLDRTGRLRLMNAAAEQLTGYTRQELDDDDAWYARLFPLPYCEQGRNIFDNIQQGAPPPGKFDAVMTAKSGKEHRIHWQCSEIFQADADVTYSLAGIDVTSERRQLLNVQTAVTRLEEIVTQIRVGVAALTPDGRFCDVNQAFADFLGAAPAILLSQTYRDIVHADDAQRDMTAFRQLPDSEQPRYQAISRYIRHDGGIVWGALTASVQQRHPAQAQAGILITISDISPYKETEDELRARTTTLEQRMQQQEHQLEKAHTELQEFVSIASHDLKTPLRGISRLAYWLAQEYADCIDERGHDMTNMLIARVRRLDKLIDGLLEYSRVGQRLAPPTPINLRRFINQLLMTLPVPQHIEIAVSANLPTIVAHPDNMRRVFENLLDNAIRFMDKPAGSIAITCRPVEDAWVFNVRDNGPGIDPKYHQKIFHIFETLDSKDMSANTGIGLALVKKIITNYGGEIWVDSTPGSGSAFVFTLPKHA